MHKGCFGRCIRKGVELALHDEELYDRNGAPTTRGAGLRRVDAFFERYPTITDSTIEVLSCRLDGDYADVELATTWTTVQTQPSDLLKTVGRSYLRMKRTSNDYWEVIQARIAGWD